jgi:hypothetical protein
MNTTFDLGAHASAQNRALQPRHCQPLQCCLRCTQAELTVAATEVLPHHPQEGEAGTVSFSVCNKTKGMCLASIKKWHRCGMPA